MLTFCNSYVLWLQRCVQLRLVTVTFCDVNVVWCYVLSQYRKFRWESRRKGFLIFEEKGKYLTIYEEAVSHIWLCTRSLLNSLNMRKIFFSFFSVQRRATWGWQSSQSLMMKAAAEATRRTRTQRRLVFSMSAFEKKLDESTFRIRYIRSSNRWVKRK